MKTKAAKCSRKNDTHSHHSVSVPVSMTFICRPGMLAGMVGERQLQDVLEVIRQHHVAALMREPVGEPGDQRAGRDDEQAETDPGADERRERPRRRPDARGSVPDKASTMRPNSTGSTNCAAASAILASASDDGQARVGPQQAEHAKVEADEGHGPVLAAARDFSAAKAVEVGVRGRVDSAMASVY